ncbi:MAG: type IV-A pilus assembly ATPase PilB [Candidatus Rokubacteria bacterium]|nr:type IV-A pilus assembly ATPase PilB [Candidatus Rokubacteria bacterium]
MEAAKASEGQRPVGRRLGDLLVAAGLVAPTQLAEALAEQKRTGEKLGPVLVRLGLVSEEQLVKVLSSQYGIPTVTLSDITLEPELLKLVPAWIAKKYELVPVHYANGTLTLAMADPTNLSALDDMAFMTGLQVVPAIAPLSVIRQAIEHSYETSLSTLADMLTEAEAIAEEINLVRDRDLGGLVDIRQLRASADEAPVVRFVNMILLDAIRRAASDVHLEPYEDALRIRFRLDGMLHKIMDAPKQLEPALVSRIKIMANLDIAERRLPQDGSIQFRGRSREVDLRVSTLPTIFGESVSVRILDKEALKLDLSQLGFDAWCLEQFRKVIHSPHGLILITGPTGSGKTTTLYAAINTVNAPHVNIMTVEDPVEYNLKGVNQVQVKEEIGRTFAAILRSFLRHDPDVVLVGEMRDLETAQIAVRAALTGHLVLSTLHTNDCPSSIDRLLDMGIPPFLVSSSLRLILAQRLVRKICLDCREAYEADEESLAPYGHTPQGLGKCTLYRGEGCPTCNFTGMKGRVAIAEVMPIAREIRDLIRASAPTAEVREVARRQGMRTLREAGLQKVLEGMTNVDEVLRVTTE